MPEKKQEFNLSCLSPFKRAIQRICKENDKCRTCQFFLYNDCIASAFFSEEKYPEQWDCETT